MTPQELKQLEDKLEGIIIKANQSGKQETSGLVDMVIHKMETKIEESINRNVNGKINKLHDKIDAYIKTDDAWKVTYKKEDDAWKLEAQPVIDMGRNVRGFSTVSLYILGFILSVTSAVMGLLYFVRKQ